AAFPTPLAAQSPRGSLIYSGTTTGVIGAAGDTDSFTINLDAGQTLTVVAHPTTATLRPAISVLGPGAVSLGSASAAAPNQDAVLQTMAVTTAGTYTITAASAASSVGQYSLQVVLNAAVETEEHN